MLLWMVLVLLPYIYRVKFYNLHINKYMTIHTAAKGTFSVYLPDSNNNYSLLCEQDNIITNTGLNNVAAADWVDQFICLVAGTDSTPAAITDTTLGNLVLSSFTYNPVPMNSYSASSWSSTTGATYQFVRSFALKNYTASPLTITELGTISGVNTTNRTVFSRAVLPSSFTLAAGASAAVFYNLRLTVAATLTGSDTNGSITFTNGTLPTPYVYGIGSAPFNSISTNGAKNPNSIFSLEPSETPSLYALQDNQVYISWTACRNAFQADPLTESNTYSTNSVIEEGTFIAEPYVSGTYTRKYNILLAPGTTPSNYGFSIAKPGIAAGTLRAAGLNITFPTPYTANATNFLKWHLKLTWGR